MTLSLPTLRHIRVVQLGKSEQYVATAFKAGHPCFIEDHDGCVNDAAFRVIHKAKEMQAEGKCLLGGVIEVVTDFSNGLSGRYSIGID